MTSRDTKARLLLTTGNGPRECRIALAHLHRRIVADAVAAGLDVEADDGEEREPRSALLILSGAGARVFARAWEGGVQWVCPSPVRPNHKRRNWFVGVTALEDVALPALDPASSELRFESFRAGGPGGQHQNTTESAVRVTHLPSGVTAVARDERSQHRNKALAVERLRARLFLDAQERRAGDKAARHTRHGELERGNAARVFTGPRFVETR